MPQNALQQWLASNPGNEAVSAAANDLFFNSLSARYQTASDVNYTQQMMPLALEFQREAQRIATGADQTRIAAQGRIDTDIAGIQANAARDVANRQLAANIYRADSDVKSTMIAGDTSVRTSLIGAEGQVRTAQIGADAQRFVSERQLDQTRDTNRSQETQIGLRGEEDRRTLTQGTDETLRLRSDARGAIRSTGGRFFG